MPNAYEEIYVEYVINALVWNLNRVKKCISLIIWNLIYRNAKSIIYK